MSASSLAPELWLSIIDFATYAPRSLEHDIHSFGGWSHPLCADRQLPALVDSLFVKRTVICVCRQWRALATPFLYECIVLQKMADVPLLLATLLAYQCTHTSDRPLGAWTERLDFAFRDRNLPSDEQLDQLSDLICLMPNLTTLHVRAKMMLDWPASATDALIDTCAQSLRVLKWTGIGLPKTRGELARLLRGLPNLRVLASGTMLLENEQWDPSAVIADKLVIFEISWLDQRFFGRFTDVCFPSLRALDIQSFQTLNSASRRFIRAHGQQLRKITLGRLFELDEMLALIGEVCPRLEILEFQLCEWLSVHPNFVLPPITELWLRCGYVGQMQYMVAFFLEYLTSMKVPRLKAVRVAYSDSVECLRRQCGQLLDDWHVRAPVPLLDDDGLLLSVPKRNNVI